MKLFNRSNFKKTKSILVSAVLLMSQVVPFLSFTATAKAADTGFLTPTSTHAPNDFDVNLVANVQTSNDIYVSDSTDSEQGYSNFGLPVIPAGSTIDGITVVTEAKSTDTGDDCQLRVRLSWDNGDTYTSSKDATIDDAEATYTLGGSSDTWGRTWAPGDFTDENFVLKIQDRDPDGPANNNHDCSNSATTSVDRIQVKVYYSVLSDLTVVKSNNVGGSVVIGNSFNWVLTVTNNGAGSATFSNNQDILQDNLPNDASYSSATVLTGGGVTGTIDCGVSSDNLDCDADGVVEIPAGGWFTVTITVTPDEVGTLTNPRTGGSNMCKVDPDNLKAESNEQNNNCSDSVSVTLQPTDPNPVLGQSCGLDIALVIDNSTSIDSGELATMKTAMTAFTTAFSGTPTQFSVTRFATTGAVLQPFTTDFSAVNTAINGIPVGGGYTNWEDGLLKAKGTFDPRTNPNLVVFASDGNPNRVDNGTDASETQAVNEAVVVANSIKTATGARIIALGIGNDLDVANLQAVSSADAVITSGFDALAQTLADLAATLCGGTITTTKIVDVDGDPSTTDDQTVAANWEFDVNGSPSNPSPVTTDGNGQTPAVEVDPGTYSVNETAQAGYKVVDARCYKNQQSIGSWQANSTSVTGLAVGATDIVSCVFVNTLNQGTLIVKKVITNDNGGTVTNPSNFSFKIGDGSAIAFEADGQNDITVEAGTYTVTETTAVGYTTTYDNCTNVVVPVAGTATCTITNNDRAPSLTLNKNLVDNYGGGYSETAWTLFANGPTSFSGVSGVTSNSSFKAGSYDLGEEDGPSEPAFTMGDWDCGDVDLNGATLVVNLGDDITCTVTNTANAPKLIVTKYVINDNSGEKVASDFTMTVTGTDVSDDSFAGNEKGTEITLDVGSYSVDELDDSEYTKSFSGDCSGEIALGETKYCTITNNDNPNPSIDVYKWGPETAYEGDSIDYYIYVTNDGDVDLSNVDVEDNIAGNAEFSYSYGGNDDYILEVGETWVYTVSYEIPEGQIEDVVNTATACADILEYNDYLYKLDVLLDQVSEDNMHEYDICGSSEHTLDVLHPAINIVKSGPTSAKAGETVTYTFTVTNAGDVALDDITVDDSLINAVTYVSGDTNNDQILDLDETWVYTGQYKIPADQKADVVNIAKACGSETYLQEGDSRTSIVLDQPQTRYCDEDSHSLKISITIVLATTGVPSYLPVVFGLVLIGGALLTTRRKFVLGQE